MRKFTKIALGTLGAVVAISVIASVSGGNSAAPAASTPASTPASSTAAPAPTFAAPAPTQAAPVEMPAVESGPMTTFGNGTYEVGVDVAAGKYRSSGVEDSIAPLCYWDLTDGNGKIVDQGVANEGPSRATLKKGLTFKSSGCEDWSIQK